MARPDDRLLGTPQTAQEGTDGILRSQQVRDQQQVLAAKGGRAWKTVTYSQALDLLVVREYCGRAMPRHILGLPHYIVLIY